MRAVQRKSAHHLLLGLVLASAAAPAFATSTWAMWDNTDPKACQLSSGTSTSVGNAYDCAATVTTDPEMTATAWSTTGSGQTFASSSIQRWNWTSSPDTPVTIAGQTTGYDYGVVNPGEGSGDGQHSMDNLNNVDLIALDFASEIALTSVSIGWYSNDSDISVLRWAGSTAPASIGAALAGYTTAGLIASGWELVGHFSNVASDPGTPARTIDINGAGASSWWLVSAYSNGYGVGTTTYGGVTSTTVGGGTDMVKLLQVAGNVQPDNETPEPMSLALLGLGLAGIAASRRRRRI